MIAPTSVNNLEISEPVPVLLSFSSSLVSIIVNSSFSEDGLSVVCIWEMGIAYRKDLADHFTFSLLFYDSLIPLFCIRLYEYSSKEIIVSVFHVLCNRKAINQGF